MNIKELALALGQSDGVLFTKTELEECVALVEAQTRARCIQLVLAGTAMPVQTRTLEALQRDRKRIAKLIEEDGK